MSVLIKGMEMPKNCQECVCLNDEYFYCQAVGRQPQDENVVSRRPDWCPLDEVPNDGVVISEDEFRTYSRAVLVALTLHDLLVNLNGFAEAPKSIESVANAPADKGA